MSTAQPPMPPRRIASILWFRIFFAIALPVTFEAAYHQPQPHNVPIAVVGQASQVRLVTDELRGIDAGEFAVRQWPSEAAATAAVRDREVAAAYVSDGPAAVYLAPPRPSGPTISRECSPVSPPWPAVSLLPSSTWFPWQPVTAAPGYSSSSPR